MVSPKLAWLKNPQTATGQDHLGVKYPCEYIYSEIIKGITVVTDRIRYYSFYTWLIWAIEQHQGNLKKLSLSQIVRRADCLFTLIGLYHAKQNEKDFLHGSLVGSQKLSSVLSDFPIKISRFANAEKDNSERYFKNPLGGLGQYYLGSLRDSGFVSTSYNGKHQEIFYTKDNEANKIKGKGKPIAEAFDFGVNRLLFFEVLEKDSVEIDDLENLTSFCPCQLKQNDFERDLLTDFLFNQDIFYQKEAEGRHLTFGLLLDLIKKLSETENGLTLSQNGVNVFLECVYRDALPLSNSWISDNNLSQTKLYWRQYFANELFSIAMQTLFWAGLTKLSEENVYLSDNVAFGKWFADSFKFETNLKVNDLIEETFANLPQIYDWESKNHEIEILWQLIENINEKNDFQQLKKSVELSIKLLLTLVSRWSIDDTNNIFSILKPDNFKDYPINLSSFFWKINNVWKDLTLSELLSELSFRCIETHLKISRAKFYLDKNKDTFKIFPTELGLKVIEPQGARTISAIIKPSFTSPRIFQSLQFLVDLGIAKPNEVLSLALTDFGNKVFGGNFNERH